jgi:hypothetical protein
VALTAEGYLVTHDGAPYWTHATVFDGGTMMQRLDAWRADHPLTTTEE